MFPNLYKCHRKQTSNFDINSLLQDSKTEKNSPVATKRTSLSNSMSDYGSFVYQDHVTFKKYDIKKLKAEIDIQVGQRVQTPKSIRKSCQNLNSPKVNKKQEESTRQKDNEELTRFLEQLVFMNKIRSKRNDFIVNNEKASKRKTLILQSHLKHSKKSSDQLDIYSEADILKHEVRKQVKKVNHDVFREYLQEKKPYRTVFGELNKVSNTGALTTEKIKQIREKIQECVKGNSAHRHKKNASAIIGKPKLEEHQEQHFDNFFNEAWRDLNQEIHLKVRHESSFNWKYSNNTEVTSLIQGLQDIRKKKSKEQFVD